VRDGLYQVTVGSLCAGFVIEGGKVVRCAPVLRKAFYRDQVWPSRLQAGTRRIGQ